MLPSSLSFLDLETTGTSPYHNRIIEIGIVRVENGEVVKKYSQLLNPESFVDPFIGKLTGINLESLENAPVFPMVMDEISEILKDSILVAHSVRFDYGFLKTEFRRFGSSFTSKHFCSIKLARNLFPNLGRYNLDSIISNFNIKCVNRHRAFDDANVIWEFYKKSKELVGEKKLEKAVNIAMKKPSIPSSIKAEAVDDIPESPGVYIFYGEQKAPLYIGKSINIKDRVLSHFQNDFKNTTDTLIAAQVRDIETIETAGELGALLLESALTKQQQPLLNKKLRNARKMSVVLKTKTEDGYFSIEVKERENITVEETENVLAVFRSQRNIKDFLWELAKEYSLCPKILGLEKTKKRCFYYSLGQCKGACVKGELPLKYNLRFEEAFFKHKIKPWRFEKPIIIKEVGEKEEYFVVDKWCFLGSIKSEAETLEQLSREYVFDWDTYKILNQYILDPRNKNKISYWEDGGFLK